MLTKCPECELQVSTMAFSCPHCGYVLASKTKYKRPSKHRRLPNGFGQITKINGNLRNPYRAMVTVGKTETGRPICRILKPQGYFKTYNEAYEALVEYNRNPYDLESDMTVQKLYERWSAEYFASLKSPSSKRTIISAWAYCGEVRTMRVKDLRARHIKGCMENGEYNRHKASAGTQGRIKSMFNLMLDYAVEYELADKNYARTFNISDDVLKEKEEAKRGHIAFTADEMSKLWENINRIQYVDVILMQCYMGWRPQELGLLRLENVNLDEGYIIGGMKTEAGTNRLVPIPLNVYPLIRNFYNDAKKIGSEFLINCTDAHTHRSSYNMTYDKYAKRFNKIIKQLGLNPEHRPHDPRKHFITMLKRAKVDEYAIKYMAGHVINDITERVYTERDIQWLKDEINKISL